MVYWGVQLWVNICYVTMQGSLTQLYVFLVLSSGGNTEFLNTIFGEKLGISCLIYLLSPLLFDVKIRTKTIGQSVFAEDAT